MSPASCPCTSRLASRRSARIYIALPHPGLKGRWRPRDALASVIDRPSGAPQRRPTHVSLRTYHSARITRNTHHSARLRWPSRNKPFTPAVESKSPARWRTRTDHSLAHTQTRARAPPARQPFKWTRRSTVEEKVKKVEDDKRRPSRAEHAAESLGGGSAATSRAGLKVDSPLSNRSLPCNKSESIGWRSTTTVSPPARSRRRASPPRLAAASNQRAGLSMKRRATRATSAATRGGRAAQAPGSRPW